MKELPILSRFQGVRRNGSGWRALCPAHADRDPSLSIDVRDGKILIHCHAGCSPEAILAAAGIKPRELFLDAGDGQRRIVAEYNYNDEAGVLLFQVVRFEPKDFRQRRPNGAGGWIWDLDGVRRVLYNLPEVLKSTSVLVVEGEKNVENARKLTLVATCNSGGAGRWRDEYSESLRGRHVCVIADKDEAGRRHTRAVCRSLVGNAKSVRLVELPGERVKDLADWVQAGGTRKALLEIIKRTPELKPEGVAAWRDARPGEVAKVRAVSLGDFLSMEIPAREMLLAPVIAAQSLNMLYGVRGIGKTHIALAVALSVAGGTRFLRWEAPKPRRVLYVDGELPASLLQQWTAELAAEGASEAASENLRFITPDLQESGLPDLATMLGQAAVAEHCDWADLIVVDNLSSLVREGRENDSESWLPIQAWALELRRRGKSVLFVHHAARSGQNQRGTSKREDLLDTIIALKRSAAYSQREGLRCEVHFEKCRGFYGKDAEPFEVSLVGNGSAVPAWAVAAIQTSQFERARPLLEAGADIAVLMDELGISRATAFRLRKKYQESQSQPPVN
jgi:hypothetical protein